MPTRLLSGQRRRSSTKASHGAARTIRRRGRTFVSALAVAALLAAACGDDDDSGAETDTGSDAGTDTGEQSDDQTGGAGEESVTDYVDYIGGTAGPADDSLPPITIGWLNQEGGQVEIGAAATQGADLAVQLVNEQLGGIGGHPVVLEKCFISDSEEEGTTCGQQLGNNEDVVAVNVGGVAIGVEPFYSTIDGRKPVIVGVATTPVDTVQDNATILFGDVTHVLGPFGTYATEVLDAQTAALVFPNIPGITDGAAALEAGLTAAGVEVESVGYAQGQTDLIGPLTAAGAQDADMVIPYSDASGCVNQARALEQLGITDPAKIVSAPLCLNPMVSEGLGGDYPIWTYAIASSLFGDTTDPGMEPYIAATEEYGVEAAPDPWVIVSFASVLTTIKFLNEIGPDNLESDAIIETARGFTGPVALGAPELQCEKYDDAPAVCNDRAQFFTYAGENQFDKAAEWLQPPE
jgi:branched-chain amino acid transport system substrate-binding protein